MSESDLPEPTPEPALEPAPEALVERKPEALPAPKSSARPLLYGCLGVALALPFGILYVVLAAAFGPAGSAACAAAIVIGMFVLRQGTKRPIVGSLAVGAAVAFVLFGTCLIIISQ